MNRAYVDANVIVRLITGDPPEMADKAVQMFRLVDDGLLQLVMDGIVVAEAVWVLSSFYGFVSGEIAPILQTLLVHDGIISDEKAELLQALTLYERKNIDFVDAMIAVKMMRDGILDVYSFDKHFDRLESIKRLSPG